MDDADDVAGALLSRFAGMLEDISTTASLASTASDPVAIAAMRDRLTDASALLEASEVLVSGRATDL